MDTTQGKRHRIRKAVIGAIAGVAAITAVSAIFGGHQAPRHPAASQHHVTAAASPSAPVLGAGETTFVAAIRSALAAHGDTNTATDAQIAAIGDQICKTRGAGLDQAGTIAVIQGTGAKFDMTPSRLVKTAERDICPSEYQAPQTITYIVTGSGADVTYGPAGSNLSGPVPMTVTTPLGSPAYYAISAQLQGDGQVQCEIEVNGQVISSGTAAGGYNIAQCEISQNVITGTWESDDS